MNTTPRHTILAVDDTPENLDILKGLLKDEYRVLIAKSGVAALELLTRTTPSLILLDINMPELDGFETLSRLRKLPHLENVPVMFISAQGDLASKVRGFTLGAVDYVTKPFEPEEVLARVRTQLALVDASRLKDDVERIMRHDLKSPLNGILATAQFELERDDLDDEVRDSMQVIFDSGTVMYQMIDLSLDLFKMEMGTYHLSAQPVDVGEIFDRIHRELEPVLGAGDLSWEGTVGPTVASGDPLLCYSLLGNLVRNASEASPRGGILSVKATSQGGRLIVSIRNAGEIPDAVRARLFQKFATAGKISGTGLGLYSAKLIADALGATIEADSSEVGYTTFLVGFPTTLQE